MKCTVLPDTNTLILTENKVHTQFPCKGDFNDLYKASSPLQVTEKGEQSVKLPPKSQPTFKLMIIVDFSPLPHYISQSLHQSNIYTTGEATWW